VYNKNNTEISEEAEYLFKQIDEYLISHADGMLATQAYLAQVQCKVRELRMSLLHEFRACYSNSLHRAFGEFCDGSLYWQNRKDILMIYFTNINKLNAIDENVKRSHDMYFGGKF